MNQNLSTTTTVIFIMQLLTEGEKMKFKYETSDSIRIGKINYFVEHTVDVPISVYIIRGKKGDMIVDTGFISTYRPLLEWIKRNDFNLTDIFLTHAHQDHDWNAAKLKAEFGARIWMSEKDIDLIRNFSTQKQYPTSDEYIMRTKFINFWGSSFLFKSKPYYPDVIIKEGNMDIARDYGYDFSVVSLPGHTYGSLGIFKDDTLYCGDAYTLLDGTPGIPPHVTSIELMKKSIQNTDIITG